MPKNPNISLSFKASAFQTEIKKMNDALKTTKKEFEVTNLAIQANGNHLDLAANKIAGYAKQAELQRAITAKVREALEQATRAHADAGSRVEAARQAYERIAKSENASKEELQKLKKELDGANNTYERLGKSIQTWNNKLLDSQKAENQLKVAVKQTNNDLENHGKTMHNNMNHANHAATAMQKLMHIYMMIQMLGLAFAGKSLFDALIGDNSKFEQSMASFEVLLNGADNAKRRMDELTQFAAVTPFELPQVVDAEKRLLAYGVAAKDTQKTLEMLGDISMGNAQKLDLISLAYGQVITNSKLFGTELRQFAENGVPLLAALAEMYGVTEAEMRKMVENGEIGADAVTAALERMTSAGGQFFGMMDKQSQTMIGMWSTVKDNLGIFAREVGEESFEYLKDELGSFMDTLNQMSKSGELSEVASEWGHSVATFTEYVVEAIKILWDMKEALIAVGSAMAITSTLNAAGAAFKVLSATVSMAKAGFDAAKVSSDVLNASLLKSPWGAVAAAVGILVGALVTYNLTTEDAFAETNKLVEKTSELTEEYERNQKAADRQTNSQLGEVEIARRLAGELDGLSQKVNKTTEDKERMAGIVDHLNNKIPNLALAINSETGELNNQIGVVYNAINAYKQLLLVKAGERKASAAAESILGLEDQRKKLGNELAQLTKQQAEEEKIKNSFDMAWGPYGYDSSAFFGSSTDNQIEKVKDSIEETNKAIADANKTIEDSFNLSSKYMSKYGTPETDPYKPPTYIPPTSPPSPDSGEAEKISREDALEKEFEARRANSDRWIEEQKYYNKLSADEEIAAYERIRDYVTEYYKKGTIDYAEYQKQLRDIDKNIFAVRKSMLEEALNDSIKAEKASLDARKAALDKEDQSIKDSYDARKTAIEDYYDDIDREERQQDREEKLSELLAEEEKYQNAATKEGQDRLKKIQDEIKSINQETEKELRETEKKKELSEADAERDSLEEERLRKLEVLNEDYNKLDEAQKTVLSNISEYASISAGAIEEVTRKIQAMVQAISNLKISSSTNTQAAGNTLVGGTNVTVNDYGNKFMNGLGEVIDYTKELFDTAMNLSKGG